MRRFGDTSCDWMLREVAAGDVLAAGHAEPATTCRPLSTANADASTAATVLRPQAVRLPRTRVDTLRRPRDGYVHPARGIIHGFIPRDAPGYTIMATWDTLGIRATRSHDTILNGSSSPTTGLGRFSCRRRPILLLPSDFLAALPDRHVYLGIADRAFSSRSKPPRARRRSASPRMARLSPDVQHPQRDVPRLDAMRALDRLTTDFGLESITASVGR